MNNQPIWVQSFLPRSDKDMHLLACQTAKQTSKLQPIPLRKIIPQVGVTTFAVANLIAYAAYAGVKIPEYLTNIASQKRLLFTFKVLALYTEVSKILSRGRRTYVPTKLPKKTSVKLNGIQYHLACLHMTAIGTDIWNRKVQYMRCFWRQQVR